MTDDAALTLLLDRIRQRWPAHEKFVRKSFDSRPPAVMETSRRLADCILKLAGGDDAGLDALVDDYRFLCEQIILPEEIHFRRNGTYRLSSFAEAEAECYADPAFMARYMNGLLLSDLMWVNHVNSVTTFIDDYLPRLPANASHLEIGPGHGIFLYFAAVSGRVATVTGWDVSPTSIAHTRNALASLGVPTPPDLRVQNMFDAAPVSDADRFDSVTMSEVLEHLEDPLAALRAVHQVIRPGGLIFVNVPANSPAPDHIFLFENLEQARALVQESGFAIEQTAAFPMVGATLEQAERKKLVVSCVVVGRKD